MNILYFEDNANIYELTDIQQMLKDKLEGETIFLPNNTHLMVDVNAEVLFRLQEQLYAALEEIRVTRPEEYEAARKLSYGNKLIEKMKEINSRNLTKK